jgi:hypothetical protein
VNSGIVAICQLIRTSPASVAPFFAALQGFALHALQPQPDPQVAPLAAAFQFQRDEVAERCLAFPEPECASNTCFLMSNPIVPSFSLLSGESVALTPIS